MAARGHIAGQHESEPPLSGAAFFWQSQICECADWTDGVEMIESDGPEWRNLQAQLLIGIQYAIYEVGGIGAVFVGTLFLPDDLRPVAFVFGVILVLTCFKHVRRLTKLSSGLEREIGRLDAGREEAFAP